MKKLNLPCTNLSSVPRELNQLKYLKKLGLCKHLILEADIAVIVSIDISKNKNVSFIINPKHLSNLKT